MTANKKQQPTKTRSTKGARQMPKQPKSAKKSIKKLKLLLPQESNQVLFEMQEILNRDDWTPLLKDTFIKDSKDNVFCRHVLYDDWSEQQQLSHGGMENIHNMSFMFDLFTKEGCSKFWFTGMENPLTEATTKTLLGIQQNSHHTLLNHLNSVLAEIKGVKTNRRNKKIVVIIITNCKNMIDRAGEDVVLINEYTKVLKELDDCDNIHIVFRKCPTNNPRSPTTNNLGVFDEFDKGFDNLDVLDPFDAEKEQVEGIQIANPMTNNNPPVSWLDYTEGLHEARECGITSTEYNFDALDERNFSIPSRRRFLRLLSQQIA